jgi:hypothetical protein
MITVRYSTIDRYSDSRKFKTLAAARSYASKRIGNNPELGTGYAVSSDGIGKIVVSGVSLSELFGIARADRNSAGKFAIFETWNMEDHNGTRLVSRHTDEEDAVMSLDFHMQNDHAEHYHYGATWEGDRWVKWSILYNGKTAAEVMAEIYPEGPF